ncbi:MAG: hypothetical protein ACP5J8_02215, partial [Minisyncoccia bacterium]
MAKKLLVLLMALAILFVGIAATPVKANSELLPDIVTDKIIFVSSDPQLISILQKGTFGIVTFNS